MTSVSGRKASVTTGIASQPAAAASDAPSPLDAILPPRPEVFNSFTGEVLDPDDLDDLRKHLKEVSAFLDANYQTMRNHYESRNLLRARIGELSPTDLPAKRNMTKAQELVARCPRCATRIPRAMVVEDDDD